jgi:hypothetical protein
VRGGIPARLTRGSTCRRGTLVENKPLSGPFGPGRVLGWDQACPRRPESAQSYGTHRSRFGRTHLSRIVSQTGTKGLWPAAPAVPPLVLAGDTRRDLKSNGSFPRNPIVASPLLASKSSVTRRAAMVHLHLPFLYLPHIFSTIATHILLHLISSTKKLSSPSMFQTQWSTSRATRLLELGYTTSWLKGCLSRSRSPSVQEGWGSGSAP